MSASFSRVWAMPNRYTFQIKPIREFIGRYNRFSELSVDPFAGTSDLATYRNDIRESGIGAVEFLLGLYEQHGSGWCDLLYLDPPYSPRQISECYKDIGKKCTQIDTQSGRLYKDVRDAAKLILAPKSVVLSFGWNTVGFVRGSIPLEYMLVCHGGAHNDTICVAERWIG